MIIELSKKQTAALAVFLCLAFAVALYDAFYDPYPMSAEDISNPGVTIKFQLAPDLTKNTGRYAQAYPGDALCIIQVDPLHYRESCLGHEMRHCLEGWWHGDDKVGC